MSVQTGEEATLVAVVTKETLHHPALIPFRR
jgi:hypothetical protein